MRRRPIILLFLATALLGGAAVAFADPPVTTVAMKALAETPDAQVGPAIAVNPAGGANVGVVALDTDWRAGTGQPQTGYGSGTISSSSGATNLTDRGIFPNSSSPNSVSGGSPDVVWGPGNKVYAVELGRDQGDPNNPCTSNDGVFLSVSTNGGVNWGTPVQIANNSAEQVLSDPSIAYSPQSGRIYVAWTSTDPCTGGPPSTSVIHVQSTDELGNGIPVNVSPPSSNPQYAHPAVAALANGNAVIAYYDSANSQVLATTCSPTSCSASPVTVGPSALDTGMLGGMPVHVQPTIAAGGDGRVVVAWAQSTALQGWNIYSSTSLDGGQTFGPPTLVPADTGSADQIDPSVAIAPDGRADIAFLDSEYSPGGYEVAVSASNHPSAGYAAETWSPSVPVESAPIVPDNPVLPGPVSLGGRVGIDEVPRPSGRAWTLVAWTDTRNVTGSAPRNEDIYSTVLLHGSSTPAPIGENAAICSPGLPLVCTVPKNVTSTVPFAAADADADPLTYSIVTQGTLGSSSILDPNRPLLTYQAQPVEGTDQVQVGFTDGVHPSTMTITLHVVNTPPQITCASLTTLENTPLNISAANCASDLNGDPITLSATSPVEGTLSAPGGPVIFTPATGFVGTGAVTLIATDGESPVSRTVPVIVTKPTAIGVQIAGAATIAASTDNPVILRAAPTTADADSSTIRWSFPDRSSDWGPSISHLFTHIGTYTVTAQIGDGPPAQVRVIVQKPPLTLQKTVLSAAGKIGLRVRVANGGMLKVALLGVPGSHQLKQKLKRGTHMVTMRMPVAARTRGTVVVKLSLSLDNGGTARVKRAILIPPR